MLRDWLALFGLMIMFCGFAAYVISTAQKTHDKIYGPLVGVVLMGGGMFLFMFALIATLPH